MPRVKPAEGEIVEETTRTRVIPADPPESKKESLPDYWEFIESLKPADWQTGEYIIRIYRGRQRDHSENKIFLGKFAEPMTPERIQEQYGGGWYDCWLKVRGQLKYHVEIQIEGEPKTNATRPTFNDDGASSREDALMELVRTLREELRAARGGDATNDAIKSAIQLNGEVFKAGAETLRSTLNTPQAAAAPPDDPMRTMMMSFMQAMVNKMMNPADPIEQVSKIIGAVRGLGLGGGKEPGIGTEILRQAPGMIQQALVGVHEWRLGMDALARTRLAGHGVASAPAPAPAAQNPNGQAAAPPAVPAAAPAEPAPGGSPQMVDAMEMIERGIVRIILDPNNSIDDCVDKMIIFLDTNDATMVDRLASAGEQQILGLFKMRPILSQIPQNPRLSEIVQKFLARAREDNSPSPGA